MNRSKQARRDAKQLFRLCTVNGLLDDDRVRRVVQLIGETKYRNRFNVLSQFRRLVKLDCTRHRATVVTAAPLPPDMQARLRLGLSRAYGPGLNFSFTDSPALIGGMRIAVGDDVYDGSVQARLAALEASF